MSQTKILVLKKKQLIYVVLGAAALILIIILLVNAFRNPSEEDVTASLYTAGSYSRDITLGEYQMTLTVTVDSDRIKNCALTYAEDSVETMYPLLPTALAGLNEQLSSGFTLEELTLSEESKYTQTYLMEQIRLTISSALLDSEEALSDNTQITPTEVP